MWSLDVARIIINMYYRATINTFLRDFDQISPIHLPDILWSLPNEQDRFLTVSGKILHHAMYTKKYEYCIQKSTTVMVMTLS